MSSELPAMSSASVTPFGQPMNDKRTASGAAGSGSAPKRRKTGPKDDSHKKARIACLPCKATKQRCDGPDHYPCKRCEIYGVKCEFPPGVDVKKTPAPPKPGALATGQSTEMHAKLNEIASRLSSIESALHLSQMLSHPMTGAISSPSHHPTQSGHNESGEDDETEEHDGTDSGSILEQTNSNPIKEINESIEQVVGSASKRVAVPIDDSSPDVISRGFLTINECQQLFDFFFAAIHPWVMMLSLREDRDAANVRSKSSLLFHTILLLATAYSTPFPDPVHEQLIHITNSILAPQILNPQPHELTTDFLRAIDLLNLYKPVQLSTRRAEGKDETEAMRASKVNGLASWMLQGLLARTAERIDLASVLTKFSRAYSTSNDRSTISPAILRDLRLYYWLLSNDVHGNVQSGRRCNMEGATALTTTRLFSSLQLQPYDTRLAASVEMFEVARPILRSYSYERTRRIPKADLERYNAGMAAWEEFWLPVLKRCQSVDPLAMSVLCPFAWFITLTYNATAYVTWKTNKGVIPDDGASTGSSSGPAVPQQASPSESALPTTATTTRTKRSKSTDSGNPNRPLTQWEQEGLQRCVKAAEGLVFTLSVESRVPGEWRAIQWEACQRADGWGRLTLDETTVELSKYGMDAITCVAYIFPLVFLAKLVNEGLLTADLELVPTPKPQSNWRYTQKLPRLLELGASFLDAVAVNPFHPAREQAQVLRTLLMAGIKGVPPSAQLPRNAATTMSQADSLQMPAAQQQQQPNWTTFQTSTPSSSLRFDPSTSATGSIASPQAAPPSSAFSPGLAFMNNLVPTAGQMSPQASGGQQQQQQTLSPGTMMALQQSGMAAGSSSMGSAGNANDTLTSGAALNAVLDGFDPLFADPSMMLWNDWNAGNVGGGSTVDWNDPSPRLGSL